MPLPEENDPQKVICEMIKELNVVRTKYETLFTVKEMESQKADILLNSATRLDEKVNLLILKNQIGVDLNQLKIDSNNEISKIRYLKGLQIIKILYEKVLSLDHHFASVRTFSEINKMSNPNQYPEYSKLKDIVANKKDKKASIDLTSLLSSNTIVSIVQTLTNMISSGMTKEEKEKELANVECVLDFTLRMQNDLNTIYFETAFLQTSNEKMKQEIEILFRDYTKPIGYPSALEACRTTDDWETITQKMEEYLAKMKTSTGASQYKMQVNMEFPIDRLLQFITQYNNFIDQGGKFY
ncbi:MAG TPA: hypothetical protein VGB43_08405, partial [Flavobacterium sp.]